MSTGVPGSDPVGTAEPGGTRPASDDWLSRLGPNTRAVHLPPHPMPEQVALAPPLWRSAAWVFDDAQEYADLLDGRKAGYSYSRIDNPTVDGFANAVAALEGVGTAAQTVGQGFSSGMSAISTILLAVLSGGEHLIAPTQVYGGTYGLLTTTLPRLGITTSFVDVADLAAVEAAITPRTKLIYAETLANPTLQVPDLQALADLAHANGALLVVDSTFAAPPVCRPLRFGVDVVVHSATKYLGGHADVTAGVVVGAATVMTPIAALRRQLGTTLSPDDAWLVHRGLLTLPLRMQRHCASATTLADELAGHPGIARVDHPSRPDSPWKTLADKQFEPGMYGGIVTVSPTGGRAAGMAFCDALRLIPNATSLGGVHSKVSHVASTTHRMFDDATLLAADIDPAAVRISVGLEDVEDLLADCEQALASLGE